MSQTARLVRGRPPGEGSPGLRDPPTQGVPENPHVCVSQFLPNFWKPEGLVGHVGSNHFIPEVMKVLRCKVICSESQSTLTAEVDMLLQSPS